VKKINVDVISLQPFEALCAAIDQVMAAVAPGIGSIRGGQTGLGSKQDIMTFPIKLQRFTNYLFTSAF